MAEITTEDGFLHLCEIRRRTRLTAINIWKYAALKRIAIRQRKGRSVAFSLADCRLLAADLGIKPVPNDKEGAAR